MLGGTERVDNKGVRACNGGDGLLGYFLGVGDICQIAYPEADDV